MKTESSENQFNKQAALYAASPVHRYGPSLPVLIEMAEPKATDVALDVATGTGNTAFALAAHVGQITGLDIASGMLAQARSRADEEKVTNIDFIEGSAEELRLPDGHFSLVVSRHAPHHFHHAEKFLREVGRVLSAEGRLVLADQISPSAQVSEWIEKWERTRDPSHFLQRTIVDWRELTNAAGFKWIKDQVVPYELPFEWWVNQAGCDAQTFDQLRRQASNANDAVRQAVGLKNDPSGQIQSFVQSILVVRLEPSL